MRKANDQTSTIRLSRLTSDATLRAFFARGERDAGDKFSVPAYAPFPRPVKPLDGLVREELVYA